MLSSSAPAYRAASRALWLIAQALLQTLHVIFGAPEDVARRAPLSRKIHTLIASWLRVGEAVMRRLLIIEAGACVIAPRKPRTQHAQRKRALAPMDLAAPETWRVSFRGGIPQAAQTKRGARLAEWESQSFSPLPLARRYEALLRAFNNPRPFAERYAQRLYHNSAACAAALYAPAQARDRVEDFARLDAEARAMITRFDSS